MIHHRRKNHYPRLAFLFRCHELFCLINLFVHAREKTVPSLDFLGHIKNYS